MTDDVAGLVEFIAHLRDVASRVADVDDHIAVHQAADALQSQAAEIARLREALAGLANRVKAEGSPYHTAILALDALVYDVKRRAHQALASEPGK